MKFKRGITLVEVIIVVAILGLALMMARVGIGLFNNLAYQKKLVEAQRDAQVVVYSVARNVRNCKAIESLSPDGNTLILKMFDFPRHGYANIAALKDVANEIRLIYEYKEDTTGRYILETKILPASAGGQTTTRVLLRNLIVKPTNLPTTIPPPLFQNPDLSSVGAGAGTDGIIVSLGIRPVGYRGNTIVYSEEAMKRTGQ